MDRYRRRREQFEAFVEVLNQDDEIAALLGERDLCPCCAYPTIAARGTFEMCLLCWWEDDGQDDPCADEVWGGPNHDYSLSDCRSNFDENLTMYRPSEISTLQQNPEFLQLKRALMVVYEAMRDDVTLDQLAILYEQERALMRKLELAASGQSFST